MRPSSLSITSRRRRASARWAAVALAVSIALSATGATATGITNLGKPTNDLSTDLFPLSGFHHSAFNAVAGGKAKLVFVGTQGDGASAVERWPVVKALDQFGTLSNVQPSTSGTGTIPFFVPIATFDWSHARYRSSYATFVHVDTTGASGHPLQRLSGIAKALYDRYVRPLSAQARFNNWPIVAVGNYVQTFSRNMTEGSLVRTVFPTPGTPVEGNMHVPLSFSDAQQALIQGKDPPNMQTVENINGEANVITALICHSDGKKPSSVCNRPTIKGILKEVK